jgi:hypothetical protein
VLPVGLTGSEREYRNREIPKLGLEAAITDVMQDRRRFLATLSSAGVAGLICGSKPLAEEGPPETTTIRRAL